MCCKDWDFTCLRNVPTARQKILWITGLLNVTGRKDFGLLCAQAMISIGRLILDLLICWLRSHFVESNTWCGFYGLLDVGGFGGIEISSYTRVLAGVGNNSCRGLIIFVESTHGITQLFAAQSVAPS